MSDDLLDGAQPGETVTVDHEKTIHGINIAPRGQYGADRESQFQITDVEVIADGRDGYYDDIRVRWRENVTKQIPMQLHDDPIDIEAHRRQQRIRERTGDVPDIPDWLTRALNLGVSTVVVTGLSLFITRELTSTMTVNGEPVSFDTSVFGAVVVLTLLIGFVVFALPYLPGKVNTRGGVCR